MTDVAERFAANADQAEFWNSAQGEKWVAHQADFDQRLGPLGDALIRRAAIRPGERAIDVGCGTGATTLELAEQVGTEGSVLAIDLSAPMLALARRRSAERGQHHVRFLEADAQTHRFEQAAYDLLISRFGVMFFSDPVVAFANLRSALRPGGRLGFVCWAALERNPWFALPLAVGERWLGPPEPQPPRAPGPLAFSEPDYVAEILAAAGFADVALETVETRLPGAPTAEAEAAFACLAGPLARLIRTREPDPATTRAIVRDVAERFRPFQSEAGVRIPATVHYVRARQPA
ncbi:MAG TPA: methyltransferase domain-containing protein [Geminicoccaceae bacterium]|nr:methyltransferase domain-containing protein [Geminicoccaceae bacterium]